MPPYIPTAKAEGFTAAIDNEYLLVFFVFSVGLYVYLNWGTGLSYANRRRVILDVVGLSVQRCTKRFAGFVVMQNDGHSETVSPELFSTSLHRIFSVPHFGSNISRRLQNIGKTSTQEAPNQCLCSTPEGVCGQRKDLGMALRGKANLCAERNGQTAAVPPDKGGALCFQTCKLFWPIW